MKKYPKIKNLAEIVILIVVAFCFLFILEVKLNDENIKSEVNEISNSEMDFKEESIQVVLPEKEDKYVSITAVGDIMCHNSQYKDAYDSATGMYDFSYVFDDIKDYLSNGDITIGNLETTFAGKDRGYSNYPRFNSPEQLGLDLKNVGIDVLTTANNHCMDTGYSGLVSTLNFLDEYQIPYTGTNRSSDEQNTILYQTVNDMKIAFLSFTYGTNGIQVPKDNSYAVNLIDEELIISLLEKAKEGNPDLICVSMHWGNEYADIQNTTQENLAELLFQNGVDIILGSHPHVLQPMEKSEITLENGETKEGFVIYSLGNFISGQTKTKTKSSIILNLEVKKSGETGKISIEDIKYTPIYMYNSGDKKKGYKLLDTRKEVEKYENGEKNLTQANYKVIKEELDRVETLYTWGRGQSCVCNFLKIVNLVLLVGRTWY